jgi:heterodisulfide reductase subunit D
MKNYKKTFNKEFLNTWSICGTECGACYYHGPLIPHNYLELPPHNWAAPSEKCPSYEFFKFKTYSGVGRGDLASIVHDNPDYPVTDDLIKAFYTCTGCGMCSEICYKLRPLSAIIAIREELVDRGAKLPEPLPKIDADIDELNNMFGAKKAPDILPNTPRTGEDLYFAGCVARFQRPEVARATVKILNSAGINAAFLGQEEKCCGLIPGNDGNTAIQERKAAQNIEAFQKAGAKRIIVSCAHCYKTLKIDYKLIAGELPFEVVHAADLFSQLIEKKKIKPIKEIRKKVTYHDPCFLGRYCHIFDEPRNVLKSIPGIELSEMETWGKWSLCCGSGTKITSNCYPQFTDALTKRRLKQGKQAADTIITACNTCYNHMDTAVKRNKMELEIIDLPLLLAEAMGLKI